MKKGDTLLKISKDMNCKIEEIQRINKINDANKISEGQILKLPLNKGNNGEPKKINNSSNINNGVAKKDNHDDKDDHWFGTLAKAPDWMPDISADKIYNHIKDQILNSTAPELKNMNAESQDTGNPKQNISNYKPSIIFPFKVKPINDIGGELSNYYWGAKLNDTNASMAIFGRNRSGNRKHAGRDLYSNCKPVSKAESGFEVVAIAPGKVIASQGFYLQTNQVSIRHKTDDGREFVIRYGELDPKSITLKVGIPLSKAKY